MGVVCSSVILWLCLKWMRQPDTRRTAKMWFSEVVFETAWIFMWSFLSVKQAHQEKDWSKEWAFTGWQKHLKRHGIEAMPLHRELQNWSLFASRDILNNQWSHLCLAVQWFLSEMCVLFCSWLFDLRFELYHFVSESVRSGDQVGFTAIKVLKDAIDQPVFTPYNWLWSAIRSEGVVCVDHKEEVFEALNCTDLSCLECFWLCYLLGGLWHKNKN